MPLSFLFSPTTDADRRHLGDVLRSETVGGLLMMGAALLALLWANLAPQSYEAVSHLSLGGLSLAHWVSDGLLTIFFFVAGMELKREFVEGSLRRPASALVPIVAAACGMAIPALLYTLVNLGPGGHPHGWAIPMATDIAFALAVLAIVGSSLPAAVRSFLLTLAIVDDLGAIVVIAVFYASDLSWLHLAGSLAVIAVWGLLQRLRVEGWWWYVPLAIAAWWLMLQSGIHATIAGVALGLLVRTSLDEDDDPLDRWQHAIHPLSAGIVVPVFALFAAGVRIDGAALARLPHSKVALGILAGLVVGKFVGVAVGALTTAKATRSRSAEVSLGEVLGTAQLAGIGFTVSLLLVDLAFANDPAARADGKVAVLTASLLAALIGGAVLRRRNARHVGVEGGADRVGAALDEPAEPATGPDSTR